MLSVTAQYLDRIPVVSIDLDTSAGYSSPANNSGKTMGFQPGQSGNPNGRPRGSRNKASARREAEVEAGGLSPLAYMLAVLRDEEASTEDRKWAAQHAAVYVHPRLAQQQFKGPDGGNIVVQIVRFTDVEEEAADEAQRGADFVPLAHATEQD